jgi:hypothetical protein
VPGGLPEGLQIDEWIGHDVLLTPAGTVASGLSEVYIDGIVLFA